MAIVEKVDPRSLDEGTAERCAEISNASSKAAGASQAPVTGYSLAAQFRYTHDMRPVDGLWLARSGNGPDRAGGDVIGYASLELSTWDNPHLAFINGAVHPDHRGRGAGTALLQTQADAARVAGRDLLFSFSVRDSPTHRFLAANGFEVGQANAQRRLLFDEIDWPVIERYADEAARAAADYELVRLDGRASDEWLPSLQGLYESINDAPLDEVDLQPSSFPAERIQRYENAMAARGQHLYRLMARHRQTADWAGHTILCVDSLSPGVGIQEDTSVVRAHRGHRLGMLLKTTMLLWMRDAEPGLSTIDTWNAESNPHMIAVNDALGCFVNIRGVSLQRHLTA